MSVILTVQKSSLCIKLGISVDRKVNKKYQETRPYATKKSVQVLHHQKHVR